jgi:hypothetical protein
VAIGKGSIIAIAPTYGLVGQYQRVAYSAAKARVIGMMRAIALEPAEVVLSYHFSGSSATRSRRIVIAKPWWSNPATGLEVCLYPKDTVILPRST